MREVAVLVHNSHSTIFSASSSIIASADCGIWSSSMDAA
jgi:hypothetical protein